MCCGDSGIMLNVEMVEGKNLPRELRASEFDDSGGKTVGFLLQILTKYFSTRRVSVF